MQNKDLHKFGGLNSDDSGETIPASDYSDALNIRTGGSNEQHGEGNAETLQSEISVLINPDSLITYYGSAIGGQFVYSGYEECKIGDQVWMKKNWDAKYPGSKVYGDDENSRKVYGGLYTHGQIMASDFCPDGWHIPTEAEVDILIAELLGEAVAGGKLKDIGWWDAPNTGASDSSGFKGMPGGGFGMDVMYYGAAIGSDLVYDLLGNTGLLWLADEVPDVPVAVIDADGNEYHSVIIGNQEWLVENLKTTKYKDGTPIPSLPIDSDWYAEDGSVGHDGAYCYYNNDIANKFRGALYDWYAVDNAHGLAPAGWRIASNADWDTLIIELGGSNVAGGKLKEIGTINWEAPNSGATDEIGFKAVPTGVRNVQFIGYVGISAIYENLITSEDLTFLQGSYWWTSDYNNSQTPPAPVKFYGYYRAMSANNVGIALSYETSPVGFAVRCMRDII